MTQEQHKQGDNLAALLVYSKGLPLSFFNDPVVLSFLRYVAP